MTTLYLDLPSPIFARIAIAATRILAIGWSSLGGLRWQIWQIVAGQLGQTGRASNVGHFRLLKKLVPARRTVEHLPLMADPTPQSIDVTYVADLARLRLSPEEIATFQKQLSDVLGYVSQLEEVDVSAVSLLGDANLENRLRTDVVRPSLSVAEALANAPKQENNLIVVPRMIE